jgi:hypothetical protein
MKGTRSEIPVIFGSKGTTTFMPHSEPTMAKGRANAVMTVSFLTCKFILLDISASSMEIWAR